LSVLLGASRSGGNWFRRLIARWAGYEPAYPKQAVSLRSFCLLATVGMVGAAHFQATTSFKTATGLITVTAGISSVEGFEGAHPHYSLLGAPAIVTDTGQGATLTGSSIDAQLLRLRKNLFALQSATVKGNGHLVIDSAISDEAAREAANTAKKPYLAPTGTQVTKADSDSFTFQAIKDEGTIQIPGAWTCHQDSKGTKPSDDKKSTIAYLSSFDASGTSGEFHIFLKTDGSYDKPKNGHISGPVKFKTHHVEIDPAVKEPSITDFTGSCDNVDMDFTTTPGTVIASGHVVVEGGEGSGLGHTTCDRLVVYVDKDLHPVRYVLSGKPGTTTVKPKEGSH
jgi:hypothetical protein